MLIAALVELTATAKSPILGGLGRPSQAWFLSQLAGSRPGLTEALHDEQGLKPYTVSTLLDKFGHPLKAGIVLNKGSKCWLRITAVGDELAEALLTGILYRLPASLTLYKMEFQIEGYTLDPGEHPWAGQTTFKDISQYAGYIQSPLSLRMKFVSPTAFRSLGNDIALPLPGQIFRNLWSKWNAFAPEPMQIQDLWPGFAENCIWVRELVNVNTERWAFAEGTRGAATGFTGSVKFNLLPRSKVQEKWKGYWDGAAIVMQSLAQFAFFVGVGHHSTIGMGQTRTLSSK